MTTPQKLSPTEIQVRLDALDGWTLTAEKLHKDFTFGSFIRAFGWMSSVALVAEGMGHHPEWCNVYNRVSVDLTTHDAGGISSADFELAATMDELAG
ncbi:MAG: 4a-hydroxytetrahydrobiopterin dehydratase [Cyanobacteria bacterium J06648_11]